MCCSYPSPPYLKIIVHAFFLQSFIFFLFFFNFLAFFRSAVSLHAVTLFFLTATNNGSILFLTYQTNPFYSLFTLFSHPISPLPPFYLETYTMPHHFLSAIHCHKFLGLSVHFLQFILVPLNYSSAIQNNGDCLSVQCHYLVPLIQFTLQNKFCPTEILTPELIFHFLFFYSVILQYHQVYI